MAKPNADAIYAALNSEYGVFWKILDGATPEEHRRRFYEVLEELDDRDLDRISIQISRTREGDKVTFGNDLWLVKRTPPDAAQGGVPSGTQDDQSSEGDL